MAETTTHYRVNVGALSRRYGDETVLVAVPQLDELNDKVAEFTTRLTVVANDAEAGNESTKRHVSATVGRIEGLVTAVREIKENYAQTAAEVLKASQETKEGYTAASAELARLWKAKDDEYATIATQLTTQLTDITRRTEENYLNAAARITQFSQDAEARYAALETNVSTHFIQYRELLEGISTTLKQQAAAQERATARLDTLEQRVQAGTPSAVAERLNGIQRDLREEFNYHRPKWKKVLYGLALAFLTASAARYWVGFLNEKPPYVIVTPAAVQSGVRP